MLQKIYYVKFKDLGNLAEWIRVLSMGHGGLQKRCGLL